MNEARDVLEDFLEDTKLPLVASKNIINLLINNYDTDWVIYGKDQTRDSYTNFSSLLFTLSLLNERNQKLHKIYDRKLDYLYKNSYDKMVL